MKNFVLLIILSITILFLNSCNTFRMDVEPSQLKIIDNVMENPNIIYILDKKFPEYQCPICKYSLLNDEI